MELLKLVLIILQIVNQLLALIERTTAKPPKK